jgi:hypothetical protein
MYLYIRVPALIHFSWPKPLHQDTHTYRLSKLLKNISHRAVSINQPINSSAAEKRDYVPPTHSRQAPQQNIYRRTACFPASPASPETPAPQGRCAFYPSQKKRQPLSAKLMQFLFTSAVDTY